MASLNAFLSVIDEFIEDLEQLFPDDAKIAIYKNAFHALRKANPKRILTEFMKAIAPHVDKITAKDESLIKFFDVSIIKELNIDKRWDECSKNTKNAIWQYLNTLYILGSTIQSIPTNLLSTIEGFAEQCATEMASTGQEKMPDMATLMEGMQNAFSEANKKK